MPKNSDRFVISLSLEYRAIVDRIRTKLCEKFDAIAIPSMMAVVQRAIADLAESYGVEVPSGTNGTRTAGRPRKARKPAKARSAKKEEAANPVEVA